MRDLYQKTPEIDLPSLVKNPAVATAAFCEPFRPLPLHPRPHPRGVGVAAPVTCVDRIRASLQAGDRHGHSDRSADRAVGSPRQLDVPREHDVLPLRIELRGIVRVGIGALRRRLTADRFLHRLAVSGTWLERRAARAIIAEVDA